jgi:hypothetical protein
MRGSKRGSNMSIARCFTVVFSVFVTGCASITGTTNQSISVQTREQQGREVSGAGCELTNNKGKWFVTTPGSVMVTRSNDDMLVICRKAGVEPGQASAESATKASMFGNIVFGGGIGAVIDHNSGAAYEYPNFIQIVMGTFTKIAPPVGDQSAKSSGSTQPVAAGTQYSSMDSGVRAREAYPAGSGGSSPAPLAIVTTPEGRTLGIVVEDLSAAMAQALGVSSPGGVLVTQVAENGPAHRAGIVVGDVISSFNEVRTSNAEELAAGVRNSGTAQLVPAVLLTNRKAKNIVIDFGASQSRRL